MPEFRTYDRDAAVTYAHTWAYRRNPIYYDFSAIGGDCTNFVSQCVLAGSCVMNRTPDFGWYYISIDDRAPAWSGVDYFYDLDDETLAGMIKFAKRVACKIKEQTGCKKVATVVLGLEVAHAHIHLIPMNSENDVDFRREKLKLTPEEFAEIAKSIEL